MRTCVRWCYYTPALLLIFHGWEHWHVWAMAAALVGWVQLFEPRDNDGNFL